MKKKRGICIFIISFVIGAIALVATATAQDQEVAEQYAPILYFVDGEKCFPVDVSYAIENSYVYEIGAPTPLSESLTAEMLRNYTSDMYYLDNQRGTVVVDDDGIENDYQSKMNALGYTVYARVDASKTWIQYWLFYAFNGGDLNRHEGDWEMVQIVLSDGQPSEVMFSQHYAGQKATWDQVEKDGDHVKVYVARGSHANYIKPYSGKIGVASDTVADNGKILRPTEYSIELLNDQPWLDYAGRWGWVGTDEATAAQSILLGEAGPHGPKFREESTMWQPQTWAAGLQPANDLLFIFEWLVYHFVLLFVLFSLFSLLLLMYFIYRRKKKYGLGPRIFSLFYIDGSNQKSIGNILCIIAIVLTIFALFQPWYLVTANVIVPPYQETGTFNALSVDGINGIQIRLPNRSGPVPLGTFAVPFYLIIVIGLVFLVLSTIGISQSKKLGKRYILRGIRLFIPFILILIFIMTVTSIISLATPPNIEGSTEMYDAMQAVSTSPFSGEYTIQTTDVDGGSVQLNWGFGFGAYLLLFAGIILVMAGLLEITAHEQFFDEKSPLPTTTLKEEEQKETQKKE